MSTDARTRAWVEVEAAALLRNYRRMQRAAGGHAGVLPMVKADAYGLGMTEVVDLLRPLRPAGFGVATVEAGVRLRGHGVDERIVVFTPLAPGEEVRAARGGLEVVVGSLDSIARACSAGLVFHLEVDTGMGRAGLPLAELLSDPGEVAVALRSAGELWTGLFTHLHSADESGAPEVDTQLDRFRSAVEVLEPPPSVELHVDNSAGALLRAGGGARAAAERLPPFALLRPGIHLYGGASGPELPSPDPVVSLRARVVRIADLEAGDTVGYGATWRAPGATRIATLAIGYGDGLPRALSNRGEVLLHGRRVPVVGRVSMDMTTANISGVEGVRVGDVATLIGRDGEEAVSIEEVAGWAGTIPYEILTGLGARLPRIWESE